MNDTCSRILIVDDEPLILEVLMVTLQDEGFSVTGANSGEEALELFKQTPFDIVLTDITMAKLTGLDLLFSFKKINPLVEVILMTAYASLETAQEAIKGGAYRYLKKPFHDIDEVVDIVKEAVAAQREQRKIQKKWAEAVEQKDKLQNWLEKELERTRRLSSVGELASDVVHELNTPLTVILGYSQLLMSQRLPSNMVQDLDTICQEAERCQKMIKSLLGLAHSKIPQKIAVRVIDIIDKVLELKLYSLQKSQIIIEKDIEWGDISILADPGQIQRVLLNIVNNAQDAMEHAEEKRLTLSIKKKALSVHIAISDTGHGISQEHLDKIFESFFTTKDPGKGSGLGLSITNKIVQEHSGKIEVTSKEGEGTTFSIIFPIHITNAKKYKGLIVASEEKIVEAISHFLKKHAVIYDTIHNEDIAIACIEKGGYDIVIFDITRENESYVNILEQIPENQRKKLVVMLDNKAHFNIPEVTCLQKPFSLNELENIFSQLSLD